MAEVQGKMLICNRCEEKVFIKRMSSRIILNSHLETFDDKPIGWYQMNEKTHFCPKCAVEYGELMRDFLEKGNTEEVTND